MLTLMENSIVSSISVAGNQEVSLSISSSEVMGNGVWGVRQARSSDDVTATVADTKGPDLGQASSAEQGYSSLSVEGE